MTTKSKGRHVVWADVMDPYPKHDLPFPGDKDYHLTQEWLESLPSDSARSTWHRWRSEHRAMNNHRKNALPVKIGARCIYQDDDGSLFIVVFGEYRINLRKQVGYWTSHEPIQYPPMFSQKSSKPKSTGKKTKSTPVTTMEGLGNEAIF